MRVFLLLMFLLGFTTSIFPQSTLDSLVSLGNEQSFQFNFSDAEKTFYNVINTYPQSSLGYYYLSRNNLWFYLANKDAFSKNQYEKYFELALERGEEELDLTPDNPKTNFNLGNIYLLKSIYSSIEHNTMDAFWATKSAVKYLEEATDLDENFFAPYLPLGTIKYALGFVPGFLGWAINIVGLEGEKSIGLNYIQKAYDRSEISRTEAAYQLGKIYTEYSAEYRKAEFYLSQIVAKYPKNELFLYQYAILQIERRDLDLAQKTLSTLFKNCNPPKFHQTYSLSFFLFGEVLFKQNNFSESIKYYNKFIETSTSYDYTGIANLKIAIANYMIGDRMKAKRNLLFARNGNENIAEDSYASKMSEKYFNENFSTTDSLIVLAQNNLESGKYQLSLKLLDKIEKSGLENKSEKIDEIKIECFQELGEWDKSDGILSQYFPLGKLDENAPTKIIYFQALNYYTKKRIDDAKDFLETAFEKIDKNNSKLMKLLINLRLKLNSEKK